MRMNVPTPMSSFPSFDVSGNGFTRAHRTRCTIPSSSFSIIIWSSGASDDNLFVYYLESGPCARGAWKLHWGFLLVRRLGVALVSLEPAFSFISPIPTRHHLSLSSRLRPRPQSWYDEALPACWSFSSAVVVSCHFCPHELCVSCHLVELLYTYWDRGHYQ